MEFVCFKMWFGNARNSAERCMIEQVRSYGSFDFRSDSIGEYGVK